MAALINRLTSRPFALKVAKLKYKIRVIGTINMDAITSFHAKNDVSPIDRL